MQVQEHIPLAPLTTFQVGGPARYFVHAETENDVKEAVAYAAQHHLPLFVLGGGSNLVVSDTGWPGLVLKVAIDGVHSSAAGKTRYFLAGAGTDWDTVVAQTVRENCAGVECLSGIPGTVGGTPVQNVGAYGQEVADTISYVRVLEVSSGKIIELSNAECKLRYRSSIFNTTERGRYIVMQVMFHLQPDGEPTVEYADLKKHFTNLAEPSLQQVRDAVRQIRQNKAMLIVAGDEDCRSAGSFFKNPLVPGTEADRIEALAHKPIPRYPGQDGLVKLSAAWLVEQAGFHKGYGSGPVGISRKHALAIVNRGGAKARDIIALKDEIQQKVFETWGIQLEPEPVFVGFEEHL